MDPHFDMGGSSRFDQDAAEHLSEIGDNGSISSFSDDGTTSSDDFVHGKILEIEDPPKAVVTEFGLLDEQQHAAELDKRAGRDWIDDPRIIFSANDMFYSSDEELESEYWVGEERNSGSDGRVLKSEREPSPDTHAASAQREKRPVGTDLSARGQKSSTTEAGLEDPRKGGQPEYGKPTPSSDRQGTASEALKKSRYDERPRDRSPERR